MKLAFREYGQGKALIILHGLFGQSDNWNTLAKQFGENGFKVFALDQRNHGLSPHDPEWNYEVMAKDVYEFIQDHSLNRPIILGHSMGGKTALFFENLFPGIADKLILVDIASRAYPPHHREVLEALSAVDFEIVHSRKEAEEVLSKHLSDFGTKQFLLKNLFWKDESNKKLDWRFDLKTIATNYQNIGLPVPEFHSNTKTLVVRGGNSRYVSSEDIENYKERFSIISFVTVAGAGHWVHAEKPTELFEALLEFLKD